MEKSIIENSHRIGCFTSSEIFRLFGSKSVRETYIEEKNIERRLGRSIETESYSNDMAWGLFLEQRVHDLIETSYELKSKETKTHPTIDYWAGSADLIVVGAKVSDIKCYQPKKFCRYTDAVLKKDPEFIKAEFPKEFWQLVSNAIINCVPKAEAITYMPYRKELEEIREMARNYDESDQWKYRFIAEKEDSWLAWLPDNGYYKNLNRFEWEVSQSDKDLLTQKVLEAGKLLHSTTPIFKLNFNKTKK